MVAVLLSFVVMTPSIYSFSPDPPAYVHQHITNESGQFGRAEYVQIIQNHADITGGSTWYRICNPDTSDFRPANANDFNVSFIVNSSKLTSWGIEMRHNLSGLRNISQSLCNPFNQETILENDTIISILNKNCTEIQMQRQVEEYDWRDFNYSGFIFEAGKCYDIRIMGTYPAAFGGNSVSIDNIIGYRGMYFSEYAAWLTGWDYRKPFYVNESNNTKRINYPLGLMDGGSARQECINFTGLNNLKPNSADVRILDNSTNATVPFEIISNGTDWACLVPIVNLTANGNDSFYIYWGNADANPISFATDFSSVSPASLVVGGHRFMFKGSVIEDFDDNFSTATGFWGTGVIESNTTSRLHGSIGSCQFSGINGTVVKWLNCTNSVEGVADYSARFIFSAYNNWSRVVFSGFNGDADDGMYVICGDGTASSSSTFYRDNNGLVQISHGESAAVRDNAGIFACGKDKFGYKAHMYWNASWAQSLAKTNSSTTYDRESDASDPQVTIATTAFHNQYRWNLNQVNVYIGLTGNTTSAVHETWAWFDKKPILSFGQNETVQQVISEADARIAIERGINSSVLGTSATKQTDQQLYARNLSNSQATGRFDRVAIAGNQRWAFNYLAGSDTAVSMFNLTPALYTLEISGSTTSDITHMVSNLINNTKQ
ncbi:hypothetical protein HYY74_03500 [Candidatus Woesearchaeota archaeon]|nr:hypothetical protein [Candidatus Woesearchaeota archaeon]